MHEISNMEMYICTSIKWVQMDWICNFYTIPCWIAKNTFPHFADLMCIPGLARQKVHCHPLSSQWCIPIPERIKLHSHLCIQRFISALGWPKVHSNF